MADYTIEAVGVYAKTLTASAVDTVKYNGYAPAVEVYCDGSSSIFFTVDGSEPTIGGSNTYWLPEVPAARVVKIPFREAITVKLISSGTPEYGVTLTRG